MREQPNENAIAASPLTGVAVAGMVAMCGGAFGLILLRAVFETSTRDATVPVGLLLLGAVSTRSFVVHAITAELFIMAYPRLPTVRRQLDRPYGTLGVGAAVGTLMWIAMRAAFPMLGPVPFGPMMVTWLTMALFSGPLLVWIARLYIAPSSASAASRAAHRRIAFGLAAILPAICTLVWASGHEENWGLGLQKLFAGLVALVAIVVGTSTLLGGIWKALRLDGQRWAQAVPYLIALVAIVAVLARS